MFSWLAVPAELWASDLAQLHQPHALLNSQLAERAVVGRQAQRQRQEAEQAAARQAALERQGAPDEDAPPRREEVVSPPPADRGPPPQEARARAGLVLAAPVQAPPARTSSVRQQVVEHTTDQTVAPASPLLRENPMERAVRNAIRDAAHRALVNGSSAHPMAWIPPPRGFEAGVTAGFNAGFAEAKRQAMAHRIASPTSQQQVSIIGGGASGRKELAAQRATLEDVVSGFNDAQDRVQNRVDWAYSRSRRQRMEEEAAAAQGSDSTFDDAAADTNYDAIR